MRKKNAGLARAWVVLPLLCPLLASASLTVTYSAYLGNGVPVGPWMMVAMALVVGGLALWGLGRQRIRQGGVFLLGLVIGLSGLVFKKNANALPNVNHYNLTGTSFVDSGWDVNMTDVLTNATGQDIVLTSVLDSNGQNNLANSSTCKVGVVLKPGEACQVNHAA